MATLATASSEWLDPGNQLKVLGVVVVAPSTRTYPEPDGLEVIVTPTDNDVKVAVTVPGPPMVACAEAVGEPNVISVLSVPQDENE
jgi:hypothetical protein